MNQTHIEMPLENIKHIILILSGKGGVGKSSITTQLAFTLSLHGKSVGVLDVDLTGPNMPRFFGIETEKVTQAPGGLVPVTVHDASRNGSEISFGRLSCISLGFILSSRSTAVIWRGPKKTAMVRQFLTSTLWPDLDYLIVDTPPGTSDEHISLLETLLKETAERPEQLAGAVVVTTPQAISVSDVKKELNFCTKTGVKVLGIVENMAGFVCPHCRECTDVFSKGGGEVMAHEYDVPFLGRVPIDPAFVELVEEGKVPSYPEGTIIEGRDVGANGVHEASEAQMLVEKYTRCSLHPIFDKIVTQLKTGIGEP